ncbi:hypothetical protein FAGKG844_190030 [Frankia sp. AgKG'84/4]
MEGWAARGGEWADRADVASLGSDRVAQAVGSDGRWASGVHRAGRGADDPPGRRLDYRLTVLADACADLDEEVHRVLTEKVFPRQATVTTADEWIKTI